MPTIFEPFSKERCARCSDFPVNKDKENFPGYYERSREFRIDGYCSIYCRDMAKVEDREIDLEVQLAESQQALSEREADFYQAERAIERVNKGWIKINKEKAEIEDMVVKLVARDANALERESALNAKVEELEKVLQYILSRVLVPTRIDAMISAVLKDKDDATN